jgi:hypothetical protein
MGKGIGEGKGSIFIMRGMKLVMRMEEESVIKLCLFSMILQLKTI